MWNDLQFSFFLCSHFFFKYTFEPFCAKATGAVIAQSLERCKVILRMLILKQKSINQIINHTLNLFLCACASLLKGSDFDASNALFKTRYPTAFLWLHNWGTRTHARNRHKETRNVTQAQTKCPEKPEHRFGWRVCGELYCKGAEGRSHQTVNSDYL